MSHQQFAKGRYSSYFPVQSENGPDFPPTSKNEPDVAPEDAEQAGKPLQFVPAHVMVAPAVAGAVPEGHVL
jgi:hypothetical protein